MTAILELEGLRFSYPKSNEVLKGLSFSVGALKKVALLGPNGSGKSTTFKVISTQLQGWSGTAKIAGIDLKKDPNGVRQQLGVCFQNASLDKILTAKENLQLQGRVMGLEWAAVEKEINDLAATLRVDYLDKRVADLSGGQARRVEIMKAFLGSPKLLLLDEPTNGLDPQARKDFWQEVGDLSKRKNSSVIVTTHLIEEAEVCDELIFISDGLCVGQGEPRKLRESLGYEILEIEVADLEAKKKEVEQLLTKSEKVDLQHSSLRIFTARPAELFEALQKKWSKDIQRIEWAKPTLADVYFEKTGRSFS
jgi:ABC-2 type transport system ATP-binding protein